MARPRTICDDDILEAARSVFLEQGFQATTAEVARRAGISEGSIFKRFRSKSALFSAAMLPSFESVQWTASLEEKVGQGDLQENLTALAHAAIAFFRTIVPLMMMSWSNPGPSGCPGILDTPEPPPVRAIRRLSAYFAAEMQLGRLRPIDPEVLARTFTGGLIQFAMFEVMAPTRTMLPFPEASFVRSFIEMLWNGAGAEPSHDSSNARPQHPRSAGSRERPPRTP